jgi:tetratricopeptide (TPR) repeat protein
MIHYLSGDLNAAKEHFLESLGLSREANHQWMVLNNLSNLGNIARMAGAPREAKLWYGQSLAETRAKKNHWGEIISLRNLGWSARSLMAYNQAKRLYEESLSLSQSYNIPLEAIHSLESLGWLELFLGSFEGAIDRFNQAVTISTNLGMHHRAINSQIHIGVSNWLAGNLIGAESPLKEALQAAQKHSTSARIFPTIGYAEYLSIMGLYRAANDQLIIAQSLSDGIYLDSFISGRLTRTLGCIALAEKDFGEAVTLFEKSIETYQIISDDEQIAWSQAGLARALLGQGDWSAAHQLLTEALWTSIEIKGIIPLLFTLPATVLYLAHEDPERAASVYREIQISPFLANAPFFKDTVYGYLPDEVLSATMEGPSKKSDVVSSLWSTAASVLSNWIQVWMEEPETIKTQEPK